MTKAKTLRIFINNKEYTTEYGLTLLQACNKLGFEIPRFCYHEKLTIAGNCRMCLIEVSRPKGPLKPKPAASCALPITDGMFIHTNTILVKKARESVLEFLLINHPLDCPICDQGGECDLQDQTIVFGSDRGRFYEGKRTVSDKDCGPLIKTSMTRCIHCTRCVRFGVEIAGVDFLGTTGRGYFTEIGPYINDMVFSELSGNIIDLCPVGALTSKPYAFKARPWELKAIETIDVLDSICSNIRMDLRGLEIMRILPRLNENINEDWITDKTRFCYDGFKKQRIQKPFVKIGNRFLNVSWKGVFLWIGHKTFNLKQSSWVAITGPLIECEAILALKDFLTKMGSSNFESQLGSFINFDLRNYFLLNKKLQALEDLDFCILLGFNPRLELPLLNVRLRKAVKIKNCLVLLYGYANYLTYKFYNVSNNLRDFLKFIEGKSFLCRKFLRAENPAILKGSTLAQRVDSSSFSHFTEHLLVKNNRKFTQVINFINNNTGYINSLELGFCSSRKIQNLRVKKTSQIFYLLGVDANMFLKPLLKGAENFIIYQGFTGNALAEAAHILLPGANFTEQNGTYMNVEGRVQHGKFVKAPPGFARSNWKILASLSMFLGKPLAYTNLALLKQRLFSISPLFKDFIMSAANKEYVLPSLSPKNYSLLFIDYPFLSPFYNYYKTDIISKSSQILALTSKKFVKNINFYNLKI